MRGNYIAVFIHAIWTTKNRQPILPKKIRYPLFEHIREHADEKGIDLRIINGVENHVHCVFRLLSTQTYSWVMQMIKGESSKWLNQHFFQKSAGKNKPKEISPLHRGQDKYWDRYLHEIGRFSWQDGYGALSVSPQNVGKAIKYVFNQEVHHREQSLKQEMKLFRYYADANDQHQ